MNSLSRRLGSLFTVPTLALMLALATTPRAGAQSPDQNESSRQQRRMLTGVWEGSFPNGSRVVIDFRGSIPNSPGDRSSYHGLFTLSVTKRNPQTGEFVTQTRTGGYDITAQSRSTGILQTFGDGKDSTEIVEFLDGGREICMSQANQPNSSVVLHRK